MGNVKMARGNPNFKETVHKYCIKWHQCVVSIISFPEAPRRFVPGTWTHGGIWTSSPWWQWRCWVVQDSRDVFPQIRAFWAWIWWKHRTICFRIVTFQPTVTKRSRQVNKRAVVCSAPVTKILRSKTPTEEVNFLAAFAGQFGIEKCSLGSSGPKLSATHSGSKLYLYNLWIDFFRRFHAPEHLEQKYTLSIVYRKEGPRLTLLWRLPC